MSNLSQERRNALLAAAEVARESAYAPYSHFRVGAAVLTEEGRIVTGTNVENASYSLTICAERAAVFAAISQGARRPRAIAVVSATRALPCGACRQVLSEFADDDFEIFVAGPGGDWDRYLGGELWPFMFSTDDLEHVERPLEGRR